MEFFSFIPVTAAVVNLFLGIFILTQGPKVRLNIVYFLWALALAVWNGGTALAFYAKNYEEGLFAARVLQFGVVCLPFFLYHLSTLICNKPKNRFLTLLYSILGLFLLSNLLGILVRRVRFVPELGAYYSIGDAPFWVFAAVCTFVSASAVVLLHKSYTESSPLLRRRIQLLLVSNYLIVIFGWNDILPIIGVFNYPLTNTPILPLGSAAAIFYGLIVSYSVLQNQLLDVRLSLGRSTANMLRVMQITLVGFTLLIVISILAPHNTFSRLSFSLFALVLIGTGLFAAIVFPKLFGSGVDRIERMILGDYFEYQDRVTNFIDMLPWYTKFRDLFDDLGTIFIKTLGVTDYKILLLDHTANSFSVFKKDAVPVNSTILNSGTNSEVFSKFLDQQIEYLYLGEAGEQNRVLFRTELKDVFLFDDPDICFPFRANEDPFGLVILGPKTNKDPYTKSDLDLLTRLMRNLSLVVNQIRLQEQLRDEQELDLLGRISKGLAHDLNNLLTPVATLLQMSSGSTSGDYEIDDLVKISDRNVRTMKNYIRDSLFFSKTLKPQLALTRVDEFTIAALSVVEQRAKEKGVTVNLAKTTSDSFVVDLVLMQRLVANLLSNAIDASREGSVVELRIAATYKHSQETNWLQIMVLDYGEGISPENLEKMKAAFFTTKDSGDGKRGFGLGLAICRKIVHLHGGTLNISSQLGKGTTVQVDLPNGVMPVLIANKMENEPVEA